MQYSQDVWIESVTLIHFGMIVYLHYITRRIMEKKISVYKVIEYVALICIYITAFGSIVTVEDGIAYLIMLTLLVIFSYLKKCGPLFATTIVAILIKIFELTKVFWFAIPWWIYLIAIGGAFVSFAMYNEKTNQNSKKLLKEKLKTVKEYLDM